MHPHTLGTKNPKQPKKSVYKYFLPVYTMPSNLKGKMMDDDFDKMEQDILAIANRYSVSRLKISTLNFDREFRRGVDGSFNLVSTKAVIRVLGKTTKVPIGEGEEFSTFEEAYDATKKYWSEYYKEIRANRTPEQLASEAKRQKRYRERRKKTQTQLKRQQ